ncbi:MAG: CvpA family protein [Eubacteriales bacterium]|jgi:uncharacterized membrane protein required for colicin V production|nr:CvpA family protein [Clostridiales bacterium]
MSLLIDLLLLAIIVVCAAVGVRRGFVRTIMGFVTFFASMLGAWYFTKPVSMWISESFLAERITDPIAQFIRRMLVPSLEPSEATAKLFSDMPEALSSLLTRFGTAPSVAQSVAAESADAAGELAKFLAQPAVRVISDMLAFLLLFFGISLVLSIISAGLNAIFKLPVLSALNRAAGLAFGILVGALYAWVISYVLLLSVPYLTQVFPDQFTPATLSDTIIASWFAANNPLTLLDIDIIGGGPK